jgi:tripartite-type tricarboxylate transporter receptor subunit TctC
MRWRKILAAIATVTVIATVGAALDRRGAQAQAQRLGEAFGQTFVVENRVGANGAIATEAVARSPADGYTLLWAATPPLTINPALTKVNYDPIRKSAAKIRSARQSLSARRGGETNNRPTIEGGSAGDLDVPVNVKI